MTAHIPENTIVANTMPPRVPDDDDDDPEDEDGEPEPEEDEPAVVREPEE